MCDMIDAHLLLLYQQDTSALPSPHDLLQTAGRDSGVDRVFRDTVWYVHGFEDRVR